MAIPTETKGVDCSVLSAKLVFEKAAYRIYSARAPAPLKPFHKVATIATDFLLKAQADMNDRRHFCHPYFGQLKRLIQQQS